MIGRAGIGFARLWLSALCRRDATVTTVRDVIGWWEARRVPFKLIVGCAGIHSCLMIGIVGVGSSILFNSDFGFPDPPLFAVFGIILYGVAANICFTGGWLVELVIRKLWPRESGTFATSTFLLGLLLSVLLTLAPGVVVGAVGFFKLAAHLSALIQSH